MTFPRGCLPFPSKTNFCKVPFGRRNSNMKRLALLIAFVLCLSVATVVSGDDANTFKATLRGLGEAPPVSPQATGSFTATLSSDVATLSYTVTYANLNAQVLFLHIHFGFTTEVGGVMYCPC